MPYSKVKPLFRLDMKIFGRRIMIIEDVAEKREMICRFFASHGYEVYTTDNVVKALKAFLQEPFDIIVIKENLPVISGPETALIMRKLHPMAKIFLTMDENSDKSPIVRKEEVEYFPYVPEPVDTNALSCILDEI